MFDIGDKVVPISKSIGIPLKDSCAWNWFSDTVVEYIYVNEITTATTLHRISPQKYPDSDEIVYMLGDKSNRNSGDFFLEKDILPYIEHPKLSPEEFFDNIGIKE